MLEFLLIFCIVVAFGKLLVYIIQTIIGVPLVFWEVIQDYRKGLMSKRDRILWKIALILFFITALLITFLYLVATKGH